MARLTVVRTEVVIVIDVPAPPATPVAHHLQKTRAISQGLRAKRPRARARRKISMVTRGINKQYPRRMPRQKTMTNQNPARDAVGGADREDQPAVNHNLLRPRLKSSNPKSQLHHPRIKRRGVSRAASVEM